MHDAPSEASILRTLYEKEVRDHEATKEELEKLKKIVGLFLMQEDIDRLCSPEHRSPRALEKARAAVQDALLPRGVTKRE